MSKKSTANKERHYRCKEEDSHVRWVFSPDNVFFTLMT